MIVVSEVVAPRGMVKKMEARVSTIEEQLTLLQVGMEARMDQCFAEMQQVMDNSMAAQMKALEEMMEQRMLLALEAWSRKGGTGEGRG